MLPVFLFLECSSGFDKAPTSLPENIRWDDPSFSIMLEKCGLFFQEFGLMWTSWGSWYSDGAACVL